MPNAVLRALAITAGATLLLLTGLGGQAIAKKATKTVNATATLTVARQPDEEAARSRPRRRRRRRSSCRRRAAAKSARSRPCTALRHLAAYRKTLRATKIRPGAHGTRPSCARASPRSARRR